MYELQNSWTLENSAKLSGAMHPMSWMNLRK